MNASHLQRHGYSIHALRDLARKRLPRMVFDMVDGAAGDEITRRMNEAALAGIGFIPKVLTGAPNRAQSIGLFGQRLASPLIIGPTGLAGLLWPHAELASARAAARFGTIYTTSHASTSTLEQIAAETPGPKWMQVFIYTDRGLTDEFVARAKAAGYAGLVVTVDNQVMAVRDRDARNGLMFPMRWRARGLFDLASHPGWLLRMRRAPNPTFVNYGTRTSIGAFGPVMKEQLDPSANWADLDRVRARWDGPLIVKGLLHKDEALEAQKRGADAVVVSNHGGRQLDGAIASISALPPIVEALGGSIPVLVDGGFRRGADIAKALALGATAVLIGRPHLWGVAAAGEEGVLHVLEIFARELDNAMALGGWDDLAAIARAELAFSPARFA
jgi:isopentenyl diphosphate isomerase/L-lactate dehydrogenase-like FMN-dependent dehydrogenase